MEAWFWDPSADPAGSSLTVDRARICSGIACLDAELEACSHDTLDGEAEGFGAASARHYNTGLASGAHQTGKPSALARNDARYQRHMQGKLVARRQGQEGDKTFVP